MSRAETMRLSVYWDPTDGIEYVGSLSGQDFSLAGRFNGGNSFNLGCLSGGPVEVVLSGRVSGRFSDDGRSLAAEEVLSYLYVSTGERVDVRYRWVATAPPGDGRESISRPPAAFHWSESAGAPRAAWPFRW